MVGMVAGFYVNLAQDSHLGREDIILENASATLAHGEEHGAFSWLVVDVRESNSW